jgi:hypothetical protein
MAQFPLALPHGRLEELFPDVFFVTGAMKTVFMDKPVQFSRSITVVRDGDAEEAFRGLREVVASVIEKPQLDALGQSINDFDFEAALLKLDEIAESCKQTEDQAK